MMAKAAPIEIMRWDGKKISKPGVYKNVPISVYHGGGLCDGPSISSSGLRTIWAESPAHFWAFSPLNPKRFEPPETEAFVLGRAVHFVLLGEPNFKEQFAARPDEAPDGGPWNGNKKTCRQWMAEQTKAGRTILTNKQIETIKGMALSLGREMLVRAGVLNGIPECTIAWQDSETGVWLLSRPDNIATDGLDIVDLKTTTSVSYDDLVKTLDDFSYAQQGALVVEGYKEVMGQDVTSFSLYFVEKSPPYCAELRQLKPSDLERGRLMNRSAIRTFAKCFNSGIWPGPQGIQQDASYIELSDRAQKRIDDKLRQEGLLK
jgi:hypothetical protein